MIDFKEPEILRLAAAHEERARRFYERMASRHAGSPAGDLFAWLVREEEGHVRRLSAKYGLPPHEATWDEKSLPYLIDIDRIAGEEGAEGPAGAPGTEGVRRGLGVARKAELHAAAFYAEAAGVVDDRTMKELLRDLEGEERVHLEKIESLIASIPTSDRRTT